MSNGIAYIVKRYPRYSETFIVNEILAHEACGTEVEIFSLRPPNDTRFQDAISRVRSPVSYLSSTGIKARDFWELAAAARRELPDFDDAVAEIWTEDLIDVHQAMQLARQVRARGIRHLHAHFASSPTTVARLAARMAGITYSFTAHAKDIFHTEVDARALRRKLQDAAAVITVSDYNASLLQRSVDGLADHIHRIYNGLHLDEFEFHPSTGRSDRILAVGRLVEKKGFDVLVDACAILAKRGVAFDCRIVGDGPERPALQERIGALDLEGRVELIGPLPQFAVRDELRAATIFAAPCVVAEDGNRDGLPTTLLEAMALGTPCISTDVTGIPEIVRHEQTGAVVPQRSAEALADAAQWMLARPLERATLARQARALIEERFDVRHNAAQLRGVFDAIIVPQAAQLAAG